MIEGQEASHVVVGDGSAKGAPCQRREDLGRTRRRDRAVAYGRPAGQEPGAAGRVDGRA